MEDNLLNSLLNVINLLQQYKVRYILVGGVAVALNGYYRHSIDSNGELAEKPDIDIWYEPTYDNYFNLIKVIQALGQNIEGFKNERSPNPRRSFFKLNFEDFTLDFLPEIRANIKFRDANNRKETVEIDGTAVLFLNISDLITDKKATGRKKDLEDIEQLKKRRGME